MSYLLVIFSLFLVFFVAKCVSFAQYYAAGKRTGYPIYVTFVPSQAILWHILSPMLHKKFERWLPEWIFERIDVVTHGWEFRRKARIQAKMGKIFCLVSPDECTLWIASPEVGNNVLLRRKEFMQAPITEIIIGILGSNILVSNGENWQRQRRIVAPNLSERISSSVWQESCRQAKTMLDYMIEHPGDETLPGLKTIALNILGHVGYGNTLDWKSDSENQASNISKEDLNYFNTMSLITLHLMEAALLPHWLMKLPFMPKYMRTLGSALGHMPKYTRELLEGERRAARENSEPRNYFLSMLVRLSDQAASQDGKELALTDDEISGNLFVVSAAGFDTTANTMGYAVILLTAYPEWQDWLRVELDAFDPDASTWDYDETFPKLKRVLALMFETLRLFTPVLHTTRSIAEAQQITDSNGVHQLTAPMLVYVSAQSMHYDTDIWGPDAMEFKPSRWIGLDNQLVTPPKGTFLPWSGGPRVCPGMKMSQVEFVAAFATLFRSARCEPLLSDKQTVDQAREKLKFMMADSVPKLTLSPRDHREIKLKWSTTG